MASEWFVKKNEKWHGPFSFQRLNALAASGKLLMEDLIRKGAEAKPVAAGNVRGLFKEPEAVPPEIPVVQSDESNDSSDDAPFDDQDWYYAVGGKRTGPVSLSSLKSFFADGQLNATTLVWHGTMYEWKPAVEIEEMCIPDTQGKFQNSFFRLLSFLSLKVNSGASEVAANSQAFAQRSIRQAERQKLVSISLPKAYRRLGQAVYAARTFSEDFAELFHKIDDFLEQIKKLKQSTNVEPQATLASQAKNLASHLRDLALAQSLAVKVTSLMTRLGKDVYDKYESECGPPEIIEVIAANRKRIETLDSEIQTIDKAKNGKTFTPKRIATGGGFLIATLLIVSWSFMFYLGRLASGLPELPKTVRAVNQDFGSINERNALEKPSIKNKQNLELKNSPANSEKEVSVGVNNDHHLFSSQLLTKAQFIQQLRELMARGRIDDIITQAEFSGNSLREHFGSPDTNVEWTDSKRLYGYRCRDGIIQLEVYVTELGTYLSEINQY